MKSYLLRRLTVELVSISRPESASTLVLVSIAAKRALGSLPAWRIRHVVGAGRGRRRERLLPLSHS
jgi:hypothetical protein